MNNYTSMEEKIALLIIGMVFGLTAGYGLGGWMEYRKGFETGMRTCISITNSVTVSPRSE